MTEPDVTLTDYALALECALFAWLLARSGSIRRSPRRWWALFFGAVGLAALTGGTVHGFFLDPQTAGHAILWPATLLAIGLAAVAAWVIGAELILTAAAVRGVAAAAGLGFAGYAAVVLLADRRFLVAVGAYLPAAIFLAIALAVMYKRRRQRAALTGLAGLGLTFAAAAVQLGGLALHPVYFNHNALYHLIQAVGLFLLYRSSRGLAKPDRSG